MEVIGRRDDVEAAELRKLELPDVHACEADFLPSLWGVGLACGIHGLVEAGEVHEARCQAAIILDVEVQDARRLEARLVEAPIATLLNLRLVWTCSQTATRSHVHVGQKTHPEVNNIHHRNYAAATGAVATGMTH